MEATIRRRLAGDEELCALLAELGNEPAIFYAKSADDLAMQTNYPQIVFTTEKFNDAAHGLSGLLNIEIISSSFFESKGSILYLKDPSMRQGS